MQVWKIRQALRVFPQRAEGAEYEATSSAPKARNMKARGKRRTT
jgi:hypothetical protein